MADLQAVNVLRQAQRHAFADIRELVDAAGNPIPLQDLPDDIASALQSLEIEYSPTGQPRIKYKLVDKGAAVDRVMRHLGLFEADNRQTGNPVADMLSAIHGSGSRLPLAE